MAKHRIIEIALSLSHPYTTLVEIVRGIGQYSRRFGPWKTVLIRPDSSTQWPRKSAPPDATIIDYEIYRSLGTSGGPYPDRPCVSVMGVQHPIDLPVVAPDDPAAGRLAAEHLIQRGLESLAYCGTDEPFSLRREEGFYAAAHEAQVPVTSLTRKAGSQNRYHRIDGIRSRRLGQWLRQLPHPVGILACTDAAAALVIEACDQLSMRIPEEVSMVGIDNDELICDYGLVGLTSIDRDMARVGYEAAARLDRLLQGQSVAGKVHLVSPKEVIPRQSTDRMMHRNPQFAQAWQYMRDRCGESITLEDILDVVPVSRSTLERAFKQALGRTPGEELRRLRLRRACKLLLETTMPMVEIAANCGMSSLSYFSQAFKKQFDMPPTEYRRRRRM
jgi:LacI family transcriptional regulator